MSQDERIDRLNALLGKVRAAAVERGLKLPKDLPPGTLAETLRQRRASQPDEIAAPGEPGGRGVPMPRQRIEASEAPRVSGSLDDEETSTGHVDEIERIALEEERIARERDEEEIRRSGLLDDDSELVDEVELLDDEDATTDPPSPSSEAEAYASAAFSSSRPDPGRPTKAFDPAFEDVHNESESVRPEPEPRDSAVGGRPIELSDDFERAIASFASRQSHRASAPLELENLEETLSRLPPADSAPPALVTPPAQLDSPAPPQPPLQPLAHLQPPTLLEPPFVPALDARVQPPTLFEAPPVTVPSGSPLEPPPRFEPPRFEPPRFEPPRFEPPRFEPPRFEPPRFEPPRFKAPTESFERPGEGRPDLTDEAPRIQARRDGEALESEAFQPFRPPLESATFPVTDQFSAEVPHHVSEPPFDVSEPSHFDEPAEPLLDEAPESSRRPVAFGEPADPELSSDPPESGEVQSQPYPRGTTVASTESLTDCDNSSAQNDDDSPATMHRMAFDDGDAPTPKPVQHEPGIAATSAAAHTAIPLREVETVARTRGEPAPDLVVITPRPLQRATSFGAILDRAVSLLAPRE